MFITVLGQYVPILIESSSGPSKYRSVLSNVWNALWDPKRLYS